MEKKGFGLDFSDFRSRAIAEGKRYGKDEYVFVREFAQNARDAGARRISVSTTFHPGESEDSGTLELTFTDDGSGMAFEHARRYLFTLYASSKEKEAASAGQFGVGFWSILLFSPQRILIYSKTDRENWGVEFNQTLDRERIVESPLAARGSRVVAYKHFTREQAEQCQLDIERSLRRYCRFLRRNNRRASPLEVHYNQKRIDGPMVLEGECAATCAYRDVQGAVALGKSPQVSLHVRGLPVWSGTSLSELQYGAAPELPVSYPRGLAPVYLLNGNKLSVTLDRRSVFDDNALQQTRRIAGREMRKLVAGYLDGIAPPGILGRLEYFFSALSEDFLYHFVRRVLPLWPIFVVLLVLGTAGGLLFPGELKNIYDAAMHDENSDVSFLPTYMGGASISGEYQKATTDTGTGDGLDMTYAPASESPYFRLQTVEQLHTGSGAKSGRLTPYRIPAEYHCPDHCLEISVMLEPGTGVYHLPVPTGYYIDKSTVVHTENVAGELVRSSKDDWLFVQRFYDGKASPRIQYRAGPVVTRLTDAERFLGYPRIRLPDAYDSALEKAREFSSVEKKVQMLTVLVEQSILYDTSPETVEKYREFFGSDVSRNWYDFVFALNKGDCDVKNIILINLLRRLKIPTRLAIGYVGNNGRTETGKHAWVEYFHEGWKLADATGRAPESAEEAVGEDSDVSVGQPRPLPVDGAAGSVRPDPVTHPADSTIRKATEVIASSSPEVTRERLLWASIGVGMLILIIFGLLVRRVFRTSPPTPTDAQEKLAAQMLQAALENEKMKIRGSALFSRPLIPTWNATRITMNRALKLARKRKLFYSEFENPLVQRIVSEKGTVVKTERPEFAPVVSRLAGSLNVEEIDGLHPEDITTTGDDESMSYRVCRHLSTMTASLGFPSNLIVPCRGLTGMLFREFDLTPLPMQWRKNIPDQFVALSLANESAWESLVSLGGSPQDAAALLLDRIIAHCAIFDEARTELRQSLARIPAPVHDNREHLK